MKHEHNGQFNTLGFLFYDLIHIITAVIILISLFANGPKEIAEEIINGDGFVIEFVSEVTEIILGLVLICFVDFIIRNLDVKIERLAITFAFMIASLALILPSLPSISHVLLFVLEGKGSFLGFFLSLLEMLIPLLALVFFVVALLRVRANLKLWALFLVIGMSLMVLTSVVNLVDIIATLAKGEEFELIVIFEVISLFAPAFPTFFGIRDLKKMGLIFSKESVTIALQ